MIHSIRTSSVLVSSIVLSCAAATFANEQSDPIVVGKSALRKTKVPWYDADADAVRIISLQNESEVGDRQDWQKSKTKRPEWKWDWNWDWWPNSGGTGGGGGSFRLPTFGELLQYLGWILLFVVLGGLIYSLIRSFLNLEADNETVAAKQTADDEDRTDEQRIRELPVQPSSKKGDFLSTAQSNYEAGRYADAIIYLFSHRLIQLDRAGIIRLTRGKTNRQYLYEASRSEDLRKIFGQTIVCFEDVFFGKHDLSRDRFERAWADNNEFNSIIQKAYE